MFRRSFAKKDVHRRLDDFNQFVVQLRYSEKATSIHWVERRKLEVNKFRPWDTVNSDLVRLLAIYAMTNCVRTKRNLIKRKSCRAHARERLPRLISFGVATNSLRNSR